MMKQFFTADDEKSNANLFPGEPRDLSAECGDAAGFDTIDLGEDKPKPAKKAAARKK